MYYHSRKTRKKYLGFPKTAGCDFCKPERLVQGIIKETSHARIVPNRTFYDQWELSRVLDHLLILPKRHVLSLSDLDAAGRADIMDLIAEYEAAGYEIYARSPISATRSVPHQHTHLIKTDHKPGRGLFYWHKPYIMWRFK